MKPAGRAFLLAAGIALADIATKQAVQVNLALGERIPLTSFFNLVYHLNPGAAFSFFAGAGGWQKPVLLAFGVVASIVVAWLMLRGDDNRWLLFGLAGILGGAIGNVVDRARQGAVVDWLDFHVGGWHWPAFNLADTGITLGAAALIMSELFKPKAAARSP